MSTQKSSFSDEDTKKSRTPRRTRRPASKKTPPPEQDSDMDSFDEGLDLEPISKGGAEASTDDDTGDSGDGQRRRRRRRRRGGRSDSNNSNSSSNSNSNSNSGSNSSSGSNSGSGSGGGRNQQYNQRRGDRPSGGGGGGRNRSNQQGGRKRDNSGNRDRNSNSNNRRTRAVYTGEEINGIIKGVLELHPKGYGFLRDPSKNYAAQESDSFVSSSIIEKYSLREGILIEGDVGPGAKGQGPRLKEIVSIDGRTVEEYATIKNFEDLTPINPCEQIRLETGPQPVTMRVMDLLTPIGKGQRALLVAPPRTGKTMLLQDIANSVSINHPEVHLMVLLIDERPEEVTEMTRRIKGEVIASSMDRDVESHVRISQLIIERGKRIAESGKDVFILLDSITRTARAFNKWIGNTGRTMSGGLDVKAMDIPKKMFGTARLFDEGGSLTVVATALIDTGSRMDEVIFQEFKGTGNMELVLSRDLADRRIWPSIDISRSGTRREELILPPETIDCLTMLRRSLIQLSPIEAMDELTRRLAQFPSNEEFLQKIKMIL
ncbi:hypothetical protein Pla110_19370 [Polystyrenella longa]|uniref:Transcription termination factor Rho n=1 Tax=Polystyrenella longa TaxID=2528007 RepID=A0A518CLZ1_9PLAN|nr:transcription termination factor Rho [Polystyrenella longa]QDU80213.1 hypothetical protein Pla110_19370 [Polystyrenella longa]